MATIFKNLTDGDVFTDTTKVVTGLFSGTGTLAGTSMYTASLSASNKSYYYEIQDGAATTSTAYFDVSWGSHNGYGKAGTYNEAEATYKQMVNVFLDDPHLKFTFSDVSGSDTGTEETEIYIMSVNTAHLKDRIAQKFTLELGGFDSAGTGVVKRKFTNYTASRYPSIAGDYYKIVSGATGVPVTDSNGITTVGHFWPNLGTMIFSATHMSASIPGAKTAGGLVSGSSDTNQKGSGLAPNLAANANVDHAYKFFSAFRSGSIVMQNEQDLNQTTYYCRMFHHEYNFSSNPTFLVSGSALGDIKPEFVGDPVTFVTGVGLYNSFGELIAVAKLNQPQRKNYNTELTIAAKLDG